MFAPRTLLALAALAAAVACDSTAPDPTSPNRIVVGDGTTCPLSRSTSGGARFDCTPEPDPVPTDPPPYQGPPLPTTFVEPPGDPSPGAPGMWLGAGITPAACYTGNQAVDVDHDWWADACEEPLAKAFAPLLQFHDREQCQRGDPYYAVTFIAGPWLARIAYMPAYYEDCGVPNEIKGYVASWFTDDKHAGDSEFIMEEVKYNTTTQHWELVRAYLSAHAGTSNDRSSWIAADGFQYELRPKSYPRIYVAENKHGNYENESACEKNIIMGDICAYGWNHYRFQIWYDGNVGSRYVDLKPNGTWLRGYISARKEYFYKRVNFMGWQSVNETGSTPYYDMLMSDKFENYVYPYLLPPPPCTRNCPSDPV